MLAVYVQIHAQLALEARGDPVHAVDQVLQVYHHHAAVHDVVHQRAYIAVRVHVHGPARVARAAHHALIAGLYVLAEVRRGEHGAHLHAQILRERDHVHAQLDVPADYRVVELLQPRYQVEEPRLLVGHVEQQVGIAAHVRQLQERMPVAQAAHHEFALRVAALDARAHLGPVDRAYAHPVLGIGHAVRVVGGPVGQRVPHHRAGDAVVGRGPYAAEVVGKGRVLAGAQRVLGSIRQSGRLEAGEQQRVPLHLLAQPVLRVVMPAGGVYRKAHGYHVGFFKEYGPVHIGARGLAAGETGRAVNAGFRHLKHHPSFYVAIVHQIML